MFDTRKTGLKIMALRKAKDMTQMELADLMQVSYQAVSNWERGNSMPDISKLPDLARILNVSIEELLDSREQAQTVKRAMNDEETLTIKEIADIAPILKPSKLNEDIEKAPLEDGMPLKDLIQLAPFLSQNKLKELMERIGHNSLDELLPFAPFLDGDQLQELLIQPGELHENLDNVIRFAPFLEKDFLVDIARNVIDDDDDPGLLAPLAPFLDSETLMSLIEQAEAENINDILPLVPFLDSNDLVRLFKSLSGNDNSLGDLYKLTPFLDEEDLNSIVDNFLMGTEKEADIQDLVPHLSSKAVRDYAKKLLEQGNLKTFKKILPFLDEDNLD